MAHNANDNHADVARRLLIEIKEAIELDKRRFDKFICILEEKLSAGKGEGIVKILKEERKRVQHNFVVIQNIIEHLIAIFMAFKRRKEVL